VVADEAPYEAEPMSMGARGTISPWRRRIEFLPVRRAGLRGLDLELTRTPKWGYQLRRGLVPLDPDDFAVLREAMSIP
jgi:hypothetical protein